MEPVAGARELARIPVEERAHAQAEAPPAGLEGRAELLLVGDDEALPPRSASPRARPPRVAERRVLLVPHGRDDRNRACRHRAHHGLGAEGEEVLEAAAAAGEHDDVDLRVRCEPAQRGDDRLRRAAALHARLADDDLRRGEAPADRRHEIAARGRVGAGQRRRPRAAPAAASACARPRRAPRPRAARFSSSSATRWPPTPTRSTVVARSPSSPLQLVQLRAAGDLHPLALLEPELEPVERPARDRDLQRRAGLRVLEREEDGRPGGVPPELRDLALDPDRGQLPERARDPAVERGDAVDLPLACGRRARHAVYGPRRPAALAGSVATAGSRRPSSGRSRSSRARPRRAGRPR